MDAICLCLDKRIDEWSKLEEDCNSRGIKFHKFIAGDGSNKELKYDYIDVENPDVSRFDYGKDGFKHHHWNVLQCHKLMIKKAEEMELPYVLMLEDDSCFTSRFDKIFDGLEGFLPYFNWNIFYLGWWIGDQEDDFNTNIENLWNQSQQSRIMPYNKNIGGFHGAILNKNVFPYLSSLPNETSMDSMINKTQGLMKYVITPKVIHVKSMYSITEGAFFNRKEY